MLEKQLGVVFDRVGTGYGVLWLAGLWCSEILQHPEIVHQHTFVPGHNVLVQNDLEWTVLFYLLGQGVGRCHKVILR